MPLSLLLLLARPHCRGGGLGVGYSILHPSELDFKGLTTVPVVTELEGVKRVIPY